MQQGNPSGQAGDGQQKNIDAERQKLDADLKAGRITQAEHFKKMQDLKGGAANPPGAPAPQHGPQPTPAGAPRLPPAGRVNVPGQAPVQPITPISPVTPQSMGPKEEVPPIGQALAVASEDVEVVECYKCGGLITVTTTQRPVIIACPTCGTKGEVDATEIEPVVEEAAAPKATDAQEIDESKIFKFKRDEEPQPSGPTFGATLDEDLARQEAAAPQATPQQPEKLPPAQPIQPAQQQATQPQPTTAQPQPIQPATGQPKKPGQQK